MPKLQWDMRRWSDEVRGSGALKAHADLIVCQERVEEGTLEVVYLGAFGKDWPDIEPMRLEESGADSFLWEAKPALPERLRGTFNRLKDASGKFPDRSGAVAALLSQGVAQSTAYRHVSQLARRGILVERDGSLVLESQAVEEFDDRLVLA